MHGNVALLRTPAVRSSRGFTLLELIVVLLILGILAAIAIPTFNRIQANSVKSSVLADAEAIARNANAIAASQNGGKVNQDILILAASEAYGWGINPENAGPYTIPAGPGNAGDGKNVEPANPTPGIAITYESGSTTCVVPIEVPTTGNDNLNKAIVDPDDVTGTNCPG